MAVGTEVSSNGQRWLLLSALNSAAVLVTKCPRLVWPAAFGVLCWDALRAAVIGQPPFATVGQFTLTSTVQVVAIVPVIAALQFRLLQYRPGDHALRSARNLLHVLPTVLVTQGLAYVVIALASLVFVLPGVWLALRWSFVSIVTVAEGIVGAQAFRRSAFVSSGNYGTLFAMFILLEIFAGLPGLLFTTIGGVAVAAQAVVQLAVVFYGGAVLLVLYDKIRKCSAD